MNEDYEDPAKGIAIGVLVSVFLLWIPMLIILWRVLR